MDTTFGTGERQLRLVSVFDGTGGWFYSTSKIRDMTEKEATEVKAELDAFKRLIKPDGWKAGYARFAGTELLDGKLVIVVVTKGDDGVERRWSFDASTSLLVRHLRTSSSGRILDDRLSDYRRVGKVLFAFETTRYIDGVRTQITRYDSIEINRGVKETILHDKPAVRMGPKVF
jgi:hypothetical protein